MNWSKFFLVPLVFLLLFISLLLVNPSVKNAINWSYGLNYYNGTGPAVLMCPGFSRTSNDFITDGFADLLVLKGFSVYLMNYSSSPDDVEHIAVDVEHALNEVNKTNVSIVTHSLCGIGVRHLLLANDSRVNHFIALAAPFNGPNFWQILYLASGDLAAELRPGSDLMIGDNNKILYVNTTIYTVHGSSDVIVSESSSHWSYEKEHLEFTNLGHDLMDYKTVQEAVANYLK